MTSRQIANALGQLDIAASDRRNLHDRLTGLLFQLAPHMNAGQILIRQEIEKDLKSLHTRFDNARAMLEEASKLEQSYEADRRETVPDESHTNQID